MFRTRYYDAGQGDPIVMIHGGFTAGSSTANVFSRNIPALAKRFRVIAPDRLGCGLTGNPRIASTARPRRSNSCTNSFRR